MENEKPAFDVPASGSLGLLALGYVGLVAWRAARKSDHPTPQYSEDEG